MENGVEVEVEVECVADGVGVHVMGEVFCAMGHSHSLTHSLSHSLSLAHAPSFRRPGAALARAGLALQLATARAHSAMEKRGLRLQDIGAMDLIWLAHPPSLCLATTRLIVYKKNN